MSTQHTHFIDHMTSGQSFDQCSCGVYVCSALHPSQGVGCVLEKGHRGPHFNAWKPEVGEWRDVVESVDPKDLVLLAFVRQNTRRLTVGQVREQAKIKRGLSSVLEELRSIGLVHYSLEGTSGQMTDDIMVSRCGAIHLPYDYKLVVLAPDETEVKLRDRETAWQLLVYGTPEPRDATRGFLYPATLSERGFCSSAQNVLYNVVSSTIVDENWTTLVKPELERLYQEYMARR